MSWTLPWRRSAQIEPERWVVIDVESSGLDTSTDRLLAIAGVAVRHGASRPRIDLGDSFEVVLRQPESTVDKHNILLHGIGVAAQRAGTEAHIALTQFEQWVNGAPLLAFHSSFDQALIERTTQAVLRKRFQGEWLDLAQLAPIWHPQIRAHALDEWLARFGLHCAQRHQAAADVLATAELLIKLWPATDRAREPLRFRALQALCQQRRWLPSHP